MTLISDYMLDQNRRLHESVESFGNSGHKYVDTVIEFVRSLKSKSVLDYGCGEGSLKLSMIHRGFDPKHILEYDPAVEGKDQFPKKAVAVVACTDVLEHVEPECLDDVLRSIFSYAVKGVFLAIATRPANKTLPDGRNTHLIIEDGVWWYQCIRPIADQANFTLQKMTINWKRDGRPHNVLMWLVSRDAHDQVS